MGLFFFCADSKIFSLIHDSNTGTKLFYLLHIMGGVYYGRALAVERIDAARAAQFKAHQAGVQQYLHVVRDRGGGEAGDGGQLAGAARRFAEGVNMRRREKFRNSQCKSLD